MFEMGAPMHALQIIESSFRPPVKADTQTDLALGRSSGLLSSC